VPAADHNVQQALAEAYENKLLLGNQILATGSVPKSPLLEDKSVDTAVFTLLRKMKPLRQIEAGELMSAMNNYTARYAHALQVATRQEDLAQPERPKKVRGLTAEQMARMEREMEVIRCSIWWWPPATFRASWAIRGSAAISIATTRKSSPNSKSSSRPHHWRKAVPTCRRNNPGTVAPAVPIAIITAAVWPANSPWVAGLEGHSLSRLAHPARLNKK